MGAHPKTPAKAPFASRPLARADQPEHRQKQVAVLKQLDVLHAVADPVLQQLAQISVVRAFNSGTTILRDAGHSSNLYILLHGTARLNLRDRDGNDVLMGILSRGDCFGEGALFSQLFRGATVSAETICYLLQAPLEQVRPLLGQSPELANSLRAIYRRRLLERTLGRVPMFSMLMPMERSSIASVLQPRHIELGDSIITQGSNGDALYIIESGQVAVERDGQLIAQLEEGTFFGELSLLTGQPHNASVVAITPTDLLILPASDLKHLLEQQPELRGQLRNLAERRRSSNPVNLQTATSPQELDQIVARGVLRGNKLLVRDPSLCADGCTICAHACQERYGRARLDPHGLHVGDVAIADTCRQCRIAAECVGACPEHAIQWNDHGALIITDACTGCGACVEACPYDAVQLMPLPKVRQGPLQTVWNVARRKKQPTIPLEQQHTHRADKCDLCHGYDNLACVSACPTGALRLVSVEELFPL